MRKTLTVAAVLLGTALVVAQLPAGPVRTEQIDEFYRHRQLDILQEYFDFLALPNVADDAANIRRNAEFIRDMLARRGVSAQIMETEGNPVVYGELLSPGAQRTLLFYAHYDGQPVDPARWTDSHPFRPVLRAGKLDPATGEPAPQPLPASGPIPDDWRIYARSASDDKAPILAMAIALDALRDAAIAPACNLKFIFEGEEEAGSEHLPAFCRAHRELLDADLLFMCDGPLYFSGSPTLFFGARGIVSLELTVYGADTHLHSGHFGNWAPNAALRLVKLLASFKDDDGRVLIDGFYDTVVPLTAAERQALAAVPSYEGQLKELYGFTETEGGGVAYLELLQQPSLNIRGLASGWVGAQARTIVPASATASMDIRLVKGNDPQDMVAKVIRHVTARGYHVLDRPPTPDERRRFPRLATITTGDGYRAARTPMDLPACRAVVKALRAAGTEDLVLLPSLGGSLPIYLFEDILAAPVIGVPIVNHDNNQHQPDENLRLEQLRRGIATFAVLLTLPADPGQ
jgi:acetylornithine deacetylase/succinyl-diaminopimelate desuccinylase-like protein